LAAGITWIAGACANRVLKPRTFGVGKPDVNGDRLPGRWKNPGFSGALNDPGRARHGNSAKIRLI
jgi:hypothetical protein